MRWEGKQMYRHTLKTAVIGSALMFMTVGSASAADQDHVSFNMVVTKGTSTRLPNAAAKVQIISDGQAEDMIIVATGLKTGGKGQENPQRM
jgi:outer membrane receptor for ferrienterochelin and colicin